MFAVDSHPLRVFLPADGKTAEDARGLLCQRVEESKISLQRGNTILDAWITRDAVCRGKTPNPNYMRVLADLPASEALAMTFGQFCRTVSTSKLISQVRWMRAEVFCQTTRYAVDPGGWQGFFKLNLPSIKRLEDVSYSACNDVRAGKLTPDEAWYRFSQELLWVESHIAAEAGKKGASDLLHLFDGALNVWNRLRSVVK